VLVDGTLLLSHRRVLLPLCTARMARALAEGVTSLLPVRCDDTVLPSLPGSIAYIDARSTSPGDVAKHIMAKLAN